MCGIGKYKRLFLQRCETFSILIAVKPFKPLILHAIGTNVKFALPKFGRLNDEEKKQETRRKEVQISTCIINGNTNLKIETCDVSKRGER